jgi:hypothetical protein
MPKVKLCVIILFLLPLLLDLIPFCLFSIVHIKVKVKVKVVGLLVCYYCLAMHLEQPGLYSADFTV